MNSLLLGANAAEQNKTKKNMNTKEYRS